METIYIIIAALLPPAILWYYIWRKDINKPEPISQHLKALSLGALICIPAAILEIVFENLLFHGDPTTIFGIVIDSFLIIALVEESLKLFILWIVLRRNKYFDEHFDGIVYAVCVGLGFAAIENLVFLLYDGDGWQWTAIGRALLSVPAHYAFAVLMGFYYSFYHYVRKSRCIWLSILFVPILVHGIFDTLVLVGTVAPTIYGISFCVLIFFCYRLHRICIEKIEMLLDNDSND